MINEIVNNRLEIECNEEEDNLTTELLECPICLTDITNSDFYIIMNCCNKNIHTDCLCKWYSKRFYSKNKFKQNCFLCTKNLDETIKDVIRNYENNENNQNNQNNQNNNNNYNQNNSNTPLFRRNNNRCKENLLHCIYFTFIFIFSFILFFSLIP